MTALARPKSGTGDRPGPGGRLKVVYIGGLGRSGSTLLDRMLGQVPGFFSGGELREVWHRGLQQNALCGCGTPFRDCPFWTRVGEVAFGGWDRIEPTEVLALARRVDKHRWIPLLAVPGAWPGFDRRVHRYLSFLAPLLRAIHQVGGTRAIVDSSKAPSTAFLLRRIPEVDLRVVHLVRDSRGVAYSWTKEVIRPDIVDRVVHMHRFPPNRIGFRWLTRNLLVEVLGRMGHGAPLVRYESLVQDARPVLERILAAVEEPFSPADLGFVSNRHVDLRPAHTVMGNPSRMRSGAIRLELDDEWRSRFPRGQARAITALTWPLLRRYGYFR